MLLRRGANRLLATVGLKLSPVAEPRPWDRTFLRWIAEAERQGRDPNDVGDGEWSAGTQPIVALERFYFPHVTPEAVVLELGPGTGRYTRFLVGRARHMILVDYSTVVGSFLEKYLAGKGSFEIQTIDKPLLDGVANGTVDFAMANGVFEHLDPEESLWFLQEFFRVLRPGGTAALNFNNIMAPGGMQHLVAMRGRPGNRCIFRYYHPEAMERLAEEAGFEVTGTDTTFHTRLAWLELKKR
jgi:SAM-dependent methyltransferase